MLTASTEYAIELKGVSYLYSEGTPFEKEALHGIDVQIPKGKITGLIGHTGSGKSTLVQLFNGLYRPTQGQVLLDGRDIWEKPKEIRAVRFSVGLVFQYPEYQLFEETVKDDIAYGPKNMGLEEAEIETRVREAMEFCGLDLSLADKSPFELSGGQKRRVAMAGVLAMRPQVLVLDEPAAGLDPMGREEILGRIHAYQRKTKTAVVIVSHSMEDVGQYCDHLIVMNQGKIFCHGAPSEVFSHTEELQSVGLDVPQITQLICVLQKKGVQLPSDILTVDRAKEALLPLLKK